MYTNLRFQKPQKQELNIHHFRTPPTTTSDDNLGIRAIVQSTDTNRASGSTYCWAHSHIRSACADWSRRSPPYKSHIRLRVNLGFAPFPWPWLFATRIQARQFRPDEWWECLSKNQSWTPFEGGTFESRAVDVRGIHRRVLHPYPTESEWHRMSVHGSDPIKNGRIDVG